MSGSAPGGILTTGRRARLALLSVAALASLLLAEGALRALGQPRFDACRPDETSPWQADSEVFRVLRPRVRIGAGRTNALGLRGPVLEERRRPGTPRVLFLGDSTCWGLGVPLEESFPADATRRAGLHVGRPVEYVNGCVPGHSSFQTLAMQRRLMRFAPDVVVLYVGARNDVDRHLYFRDDAIPARVARTEAAWHRSHVLRGVEAAWDGLYKKLLRKPLSLAARARVSPAAFHRNLTQLVAASERGGAQPVVVIPPYSEPHLARYSLIPEYQQALRTVAADAGAAVVVLQPVFASRAEGDVYQEDGFHFSRTGHALAAEAIAPAISDALRGID